MRSRIKGYIAIAAVLLILGPAAVSARSENVKWPATMNPIADVAIIGIDADTLYYIGRNSDESQGYTGNFPIPRIWYSKVIGVLREAKAHTIGIDLLLTAREPLKSEDQAVAKRVAAGPPPIVFGFEMIPRAQKIQSPVNLRQFNMPNIPTTSTLAPKAASLALPYAELVGAGARIGCMRILEDSDGIVRRGLLLTKYDKYVLPSFPLQVFMKSAGVSPGQIRVYGRDARYMQIRGLDVRLAAEDTLPLILPPQRQVFEHISFLDTVFVQDSFKTGNIEKHKEKMREYFEGKIVLVGPTDNSLNDLYTTYRGKGYTGVEIQAAVLNQLLNLWAGERGIGGRRSFNPDEELSPMTEEEAVNEALNEMNKIRIEKE